MRWLRRNRYYLFVHLAGIVPLVVILTTYFSDGLVQPVRYLILRTGTIGLIFLIATLACTPMRKLFRWSGVVQMRRAMGLYGFLYVTLHVAAYAVLENELYFDLIWRDLGERRAMPIGIIAFLLLVPLAITSTNGGQRRLGKSWRTLHRLVYLALPLSVWHYLWLDRDFFTWPLIYGAIVIILLLTRLPWFRFLSKRGS